MNRRSLSAPYTTAAVLLAVLLWVGCSQPPKQMCAPPAGYGGGVFEIDADQRDAMLARADSVATSRDIAVATMKRTVEENDLTMEVRYASGESIVSRGFIVELCKPSGEVLSVRYLQ